MVKLVLEEAFVADLSIVKAWKGDEGNFNIPENRRNFNLVIIIECTNII